MSKPTKASKPEKPYKEFPLFPHSNGQWAKKIKGKAWYFGKWDDHESALAKYLDEIDEIRSGRDPRLVGIAVTSAESITVEDTMDLYVTNLADRRSSGDISERHYADCKQSCGVVVKHFGIRVKVHSLRAVDFTALKRSFPETWGPTKIGAEIQRIRTAFKWASESEVISGLPNFGPDFKKPHKSVVRRAKAERQSKHGTLDFCQSELIEILAESDGWLRASILLGINSGFGASDCGRLRPQNIQNGWYDVPRYKTGIPRRFKLWPETEAAVRSAIEKRPTPKKVDYDDLCFLTSHGKPVWWVTESGSICDNVGKSFSKIIRKLGISKPGRGFYSLRRTYETVAGNSKDQVAVNFAMGHTDDSMAAVYRQGIDDQRLIDVSEFVRSWLSS